MPRTLCTGTVGSDVAALQQRLNGWPSARPRLAVDGRFGGDTRGRVIEFQRERRIEADGVVGPETWRALDLPVACGGRDWVPPAAADAYAPLRPRVLAVARQCLDRVDFGMTCRGRPRGLDLLIEMFRLAAGVQLTDADFRRNGDGAWHWHPRVGGDAQRKHWCGVFAAYCYRKAGIPVGWDLGRGVPTGRIAPSHGRPDLAAGIRQGDIGCVRTRHHHFLIESVDGGGPMPSLTTIDGDLEFGRIQRRTMHQVGEDDFSHYRLG